MVIRDPFPQTYSVNLLHEKRKGLLWQKVRGEGGEEEQARVEEGVQCQRCRLQSDCSLQSNRCGALAQMHEASLYWLTSALHQGGTVTGYYHVDH